MSSRGGSHAVTIVTVCYNDLERLRRTAASVNASRRYVDVEHLIVDGGSADGTCPWLETWTSEGTGRRFISEPDRGIFDAMNKGAKLVGSGYIMFLNAGDLLADGGALQRFLSTVSDKDASWGYGVASIVDAEGNALRPSVGRIPYSRRRHRYGFAAICHQAVLMKKDLFEKLGGFQHDKYGLASDYAMLLRAAELSPPITWAELLVSYESGGVSETDVYRQLWRRHRARRGLVGALPVAVDAVWTTLQCVRVMAGALLRTALPRIGLTRVMGRDLQRIEANR